MTTLKKRKRRKKKQIDIQEVNKRNYRKEVRAIFSKTGFKRIAQISDKEFNFKNLYKSDFDDAFIYENIIVFTEYTLSQSSDIGAHLKIKSIVYDEIVNNKNDFLNYYSSLFPTFASARSDLYDNDQTKIIILYCAKNEFESKYKTQFSNIKYFEYPVLRYFKAVSESIRFSSRYELLKFFNIDAAEVGQNILTAKKKKTEINGTLLPEAHSNFKNGYKVVSFYIDPQTLLANSYVLRKDGWRDEGSLYQRMIVKKKISAIRKYLLKEKRVFINNIIVTLPSNTRLLNQHDKVVHVASLTKTEHVKIEISDEFNIIGLVDGQHRVFAYHEGGEKDEEISKLRIKQNLLATGIIYPDGIRDTEKSKFEANLFLEINANQANAKSDVKQAISLILNPFSSESIAFAAVRRINEQGPLENLFERHFYEKDKIKTTSIVSYGFKPLVKLSGTDSLFSLWRNKEKNTLLSKHDDTLLTKYIDFIATELNIFLGAIKSELKDRWTIDKTNKNRVLSTTSINGFIVCFRRIIEEKKTGEFAKYKSKLAGIDKFHFKKFKSSQYGAMGRELYDKFFS